MRKTTDSLWLKTVFKVSWFWLRLATKRSNPYSLIWNHILLTMIALIYLIDRKYYGEVVPPSFLFPTRTITYAGISILFLHPSKQEKNSISRAKQHRGRSQFKSIYKERKYTGPRNLICNQLERIIYGCISANDESDRLYSYICMIEITLS